MLVTTFKSIRISYSCHTTHHSQYVVIDGIDTDLGSGSSGDRGGRKNQLKDCIVYSRKVAAARRLVLLRAEGERVDVDASVRVAGVVLVRLDHIEVGPFTLRETILAVELELGSDDRVLTPAVHVKGSLREHECTGIGDIAARCDSFRTRSSGLGSKGTGPRASIGGAIKGTRILEETPRGDECTRAVGLRRATESVDRVGKGINGIGVVEGLGTKGLVQGLATFQRRAIVDVGIGLDNPDKLLARVVEVELDLVGRRTDRLITSELELLDQVLVGVLCHLSALIRIEENVVDVEGCGDERLLVGSRDRLGSRGTIKLVDGPEALTNGAEIDVDLDFVVLESNQGQCKPGVAAKPEEEGNVEGGLREGIAGSANLGRPASGRARTRDVGERGVSDVSQSRCVANHLPVPTLLLRGHSDLVPDVHPITILAIYALATDLNLNLSNELLTNEVEPTGIHTITLSLCLHLLVDLREGDLEVCAVAQITIAADCARNTATKVSLARECLLNALHSKVCVSAV